MKQLQKFGRASILVVALALMLAGCSEKAWVMIPPKVDLSGYDTVGLIEFSGNDRQLQTLATQQFQQAVQKYQPGASVVELGSERALLQSVGANRLNGESIQRIAAKHGLDAVFIGEVEVSKVAPKMDLSISLTNFRGSADVEGTLSARLVTANGATAWTGSCSDTVSIARANVNSEGAGRVGIADAAGVQRRMFENLATRVATDYQVRYVKRKLEDIPPHYVPTYPEGVKTYAPPTALSHVDG